MAEPSQELQQDSNMGSPSGDKKQGVWKKLKTLFKSLFSCFFPFHRSLHNDENLQDHETAQSEEEESKIFRAKMKQSKEYLTQLQKELKQVKKDIEFATIIRKTHEVLPVNSRDFKLDGVSREIPHFQIERYIPVRLARFDLSSQKIEDHLKDTINEQIIGL